MDKLNIKTSKYKGENFQFAGGFEDMSRSEARRGVMVASSWNISKN